MARLLFIVMLSLLKTSDLERAGRYELDEVAILNEKREALPKLEELAFA